MTAWRVAAVGWARVERHVHRILFAQRLVAAQDGSYVRQSCLMESGVVLIMTASQTGVTTNLRAAQSQKRVKVAWRIMTVKLINAVGCLRVEKQPAHMIHLVKLVAAQNGSYVSHC